MQYIVYKHTNKTTGKSYIGITKQGLMKKFYEHCKDAFGKCKINGKFHNAIVKYGKHDWKHEILFISFDYEFLNTAERLLIKEYDTKNNGYNITSGGAYHSNYNGKRNYNSMRGVNNPAKRLDVRNKISLALTGNSHSSFNGYWKTPWGYYTSMKEVKINCPYNFNMSDNLIHKYCKKSHNILSARTVWQVPFFSKDDIGKSFAELGFGYIHAERFQSLSEVLDQ